MLLSLVVFIVLTVLAVIAPSNTLYLYKLCSLRYSCYFLDFSEKVTRISKS